MFHDEVIYPSIASSTSATCRSLQLCILSERHLRWERATGAGDDSPSNLIHMVRSKTPCVITYEANSENHTSQSSEGRFSKFRRQCRGTGYLNSVQQ